MRLKISLVFLVIAGVFVYFVFAGKYFSFSSNTESSNSQGVARPLTSEQILNQLYSSDLRDYKGNKLTLEKTVIGSPEFLIIHLWASWCSPCVNEVPELVSYAQKHPDVKFIVVSLDQYQDDIAKFLKSFPEFNSDRFIKIWDGDNKFSKFINADRLPMTIIIRAQKPEPQIVQSVVDWKFLQLK